MQDPVYLANIQEEADQKAREEAARAARAVAEEVKADRAVRNAQATLSRRAEANYLRPTAASNARAKSPAAPTVAVQTARARPSSQVQKTAPSTGLRANNNMTARGATRGYFNVVPQQKPSMTTSSRPQTFQQNAGHGISHPGTQPHIPQAPGFQMENWQAFDQNIQQQPSFAPSAAPPLGWVDPNTYVFPDPIHSSLLEDYTPLYQQAPPPK
jgi:hypothetical protein